MFATTHSPRLCLSRSVREHAFDGREQILERQWFFKVVITGAASWPRLLLAVMSTTVSFRSPGVRLR